jgi:acetolactate synthase regulatory subunit
LVRTELKDKFRTSISVLIEGHITMESDVEKLKEVALIWNETFKEKARVYSVVTEILYTLDPSNSKDDELFSIFKRNIETLLEYVISNEQELDVEIDKDIWYENVDKIIDHSELIRFQVNKINATANDSAEAFKIATVVLKDRVEDTIGIIREKEDEIAEINQTQEKFINENTRLSENINKLTIDAKKVQKEFVAILGIFASILLAAFGGLEILENVMSNINDTPTGKLLLFSSLVIMGIILVIFLLLNGVSKLTGLNLRSCNCKDEDTCTCTMVKKHPSIFISTAILLIIGLTGIFEYMVDFNTMLKPIPDIIITIVGIIILITLTIIFYWRFKSAFKSETGK